MCANYPDCLLKPKSTGRIGKDMTDEKKNANRAAVGAAATIGSAAVAAALLYAGRRFRKKPDETATGGCGKVPSGEPPETD
jgi:hypothetical protein